MANESLRPDDASRGAEPRARGQGAPINLEARFLTELVQSLRKHAWVAASVFLACVLGSLAMSLSQTKIYRATATVQIDPRPPRPLGEHVEAVAEIGTGSWWSVQDYYNTQHKIIASKRIALVVAKDLGLEHDQGFLQNTRTPSPSKARRGTTEMAAQLVQTRTLVVPIKDSRLFEVSIDDADPNRATRILDAVVRAYMENNLETATASTRTAAEWLTDQLETLRQDLTASELALHQYKLDKKITSVSLDDQNNTIQSEIRQLAEARAKVRASIQGATARLAQIRSIHPENPDGIPESEIFRSENLGSLRAEYQRALREKNSLLGSGKGENHPEVQSKAAQEQTVRAALERELNNIAQGAEKDLQALRQEEGGLTHLLSELEKKALSLNLMDIEYSRLERTKQNNEKLYSLVLERTKEAGLTKMLRVNNIQVVDLPHAADAPVKPRTAVIVGLGTLVGIVLGVLGAFVRQRMDTTVKSAADLEERFGVATLGNIPLLDSEPRTGRKRWQQKQQSERPHEVVFRQPKSAFAEDIRAIRTNLLFMSPDKPFRRLLVTSASPSDGKTTVTACLGVTMAQAGHRVLLVDCDMRRPRLHEVFHFGGRPSTLSESLIDATRLDISSLDTEIPGLSVLPAGPPPPNPAELLHSAAFGHLMTRLSASFDILLLDTPPLIVTDAAILAAQVDGALIVVRAHATEHPSVGQALKALDDVGGRLVGVILNAVSERKGTYGAYYHSYSEAAEAPAT